MNRPFNGLSDGEAERLAWIAEEAAEVVQACMKVLRHGYGSNNPDSEDSADNREALEQELGNLRAAVQLAYIKGDISQHAVDTWASVKAGQAPRWLHHQESRQ